MAYIPIGRTNRLPFVAEGGVFYPGMVQCSPGYRKVRLLTGL